MTPGRVLVTGAAGRLGSAVVRELRNRGGVDVVPVISPRTLSADPSAVAVDLADADSVGRLIAAVRPESIIHLASVNGGDCDLDPARAAAVNVGSTRALLEAAQSIGLRRFVFTSSAAVYGTDRDRPLFETDELHGDTLYGRLKADAEVALAESTGATSAVVLRVFNLYGPGFDNSLVTKLRHSRQEAPVVLVGMDRFARDYVHVEDVVRAILLSLDAELPDGYQTFNVGSGTMLSNRAVVTLLEQYSALHFVVEGDQRSQSWADISLASQSLGYRPMRSVGDLNGAP